MMLRRLLEEARDAGFLHEAAPGEPVRADELVGLPNTVQRYLGFMRVVGRPPARTVLLGATGRFRLGPDKPWLACEAWQLDTGGEIGRIFHMRVRFAGLVPVLARDTYIHGKGNMLGKALGLFTVADGHGHAFDVGELVTWLNDAVFYAPSLLLRRPGVTWAGVDDGCFDVTLADAGLEVKARVFVDERGAPVDFHTTDRFVEDPFTPGHPLVRALWTTPTDSWERDTATPFPRHGRAVWKLPGGDLEYAEFNVHTLKVDAPPSEWTDRGEARGWT